MSPPRSAIQPFPRSALAFTAAITFVKLSTVEMLGSEACFVAKSFIKRLAPPCRNWLGSAPLAPPGTRRRRPGTDRGSQYASSRYRALIKDFRMTQSMSRRANCWDNAPMESFFKTLKVERIYQLRYGTRAQARLDIVDWIEGFYNLERMHSSIGYRTPVSAESGPMAA